MEIFAPTRTLVVNVNHLITDINSADYLDRTLGYGDQAYVVDYQVEIIDGHPSVTFSLKLQNEDYDFVGNGAFGSTEALRGIVGHLLDPLNIGVTVPVEYTGPASLYIIDQEEISIYSDYYDTITAEGRQIRDNAFKSFNGAYDFLSLIGVNSGEFFSTFPEALATVSLSGTREFAVLAVAKFAIWAAPILLGASTREDGTPSSHLNSIDYSVPGMVVYRGVYQGGTPFEIRQTYGSSLDNSTLIAKYSETGELLASISVGDSGLVAEFFDGTASHTVLPGLSELGMGGQGLALAFGEVDFAVRSLTLAWDTEAQSGLASGLLIRADGTQVQVEFPTLATVAPGLVLWQRTEVAADGATLQADAGVSWYSGEAWQRAELLAGTALASLLGDYAVEASHAVVDGLDSFTLQGVSPDGVPSFTLDFDIDAANGARANLSGTFLGQMPIAWAMANTTDLALDKAAWEQAWAGVDISDATSLTVTQQQGINLTAATLQYLDNRNTTVYFGHDPVLENLENYADSMPDGMMESLIGSVSVEEAAWMAASWTADNKLEQVKLASADGTRVEAKAVPNPFGPEIWDYDVYSPSGTLVRHDIRTTLNGEPVTYVQYHATDAAGEPTGPVQTAVYKATGELVGGQIGSILGSSLGQALAGENTFRRSGRRRCSARCCRTSARRSAPCWTGRSISPTQRMRRPRWPICSMPTAGPHDPHERPRLRSAAARAPGHHSPNACPRHPRPAYRHPAVPCACPDAAKAATGLRRSAMIIPPGGSAPAGVPPG